MSVKNKSSLPHEKYYISSVTFFFKYYFSLLSFMMLLNIAVTQGQKNTDYYMGKGQEELQKNNFTGAIALFNKVIEEKKENHLAYFYRGFAKMQLGDLIGAESDFERTTMIHRGYSGGYYYLGIIKAEKKDYFDALKNFDRAIELNCTNTDYFNARGYVKTMIWDTMAAEEDLNQSILLNNANVNAWYNRSVLWLNSKKYEKALADCNKAIGINPAFDELFLLRGHIRLCMEDSLSAYKDFEYVLSRDSGNIAAYYNLALYYHHTKDYQNAMRHYSKVIALNPYNSECYFNRAALYAENEQYQEAVSDYTHVISINPQNLLAYFYRAEIRQQQNDLIGAIDDYSKVISLYPAFYYAYYMRSMLYRQINDYDGYRRDKMMAEHLMNSTDTTLYNETQLNSFKSLFELRTEVENADTSSGKIQYKSYEISIKPLYYLMAADPAQQAALPLTPKDYNAQLAELNSLSEILLHLEFIHNDQQAGKEKIIKERDRLQEITLKENNNEALLIWSSILSASLFNYSEALTLLTGISDTSGFSYLAWFIRGNIHYDLGQNLEQNQKNMDLISGNDTKDRNDYYYKALEDYTAAIEKNNKFTFAYFNRAYVKTMLNDYSGAILDYSVSIFYNTSFAEAYFSRGLLYLFTGNIEKGCEDISKAGELGLKESYNLLFKHCKK